MTNQITYPYDSESILRKKKSIRRTLMLQQDLIEKRIAILGGSTTSDIKDVLEIFLLSNGVKPIFYESEYNRYYEDIMFPNLVLDQFAPEVIYIHTSSVNILKFPAIDQSEQDVKNLINSTTQRFADIWDKIASKYGCPVIQNNFELPHYRGLGNLDFYDIHGRTRFITEINNWFAAQAMMRSSLHINDINYLSAWFGLEKWYDKLFWYSYKYAMSYEAIPLISDSVASIILAVFGKSKKCLVLDLDNTLWGGVIGDDGLGGIEIGKETAAAEAYTEFQQFVKGLKERGIILAVCSKNDHKYAAEGFSHPDSVLKYDDFSAFVANWNPKHENIRHIASTLNIGIDSLVFIDDNPVERDMVRAQEPAVTVPEFGNNVAKYIDILDKTGLFEVVSISSDDLQRSSFYSKNVERTNLQHTYENYCEYLFSLEMRAEIKSFEKIYYERIVQLINKSNQFNVTTRRYTLDEVVEVVNSGNYIHLYGRLVDKFGDNGLVAIVIGEVRRRELHVDLWLMSCRVLKRDMELAMLDELVLCAKQRGVTAIFGYYYPTPKNSMVENLFKEFGFECIKNEAAGSVWRLNIEQCYNNKNHVIEVNK